MGETLFSKTQIYLEKVPFRFHSIPEGAELRSEERWLVERAGGIPGHTHRIYVSGPQQTYLFSFLLNQFNFYFDHLENGAEEEKLQDLETSNTQMNRDFYFFKIP